MQPIFDDTWLTWALLATITLTLCVLIAGALFAYHSAQDYFELKQERKKINKLWIDLADEMREFDAKKREQEDLHLLRMKLLTPSREED